MNMTAAHSGWRERGRLARTLGFGAVAMTGAARRDLLIRGVDGSATISEVWPQRTETGHVFRVWVRVDGRPPYEARACQEVSAVDLARMRPGAIVRCLVDPRDEDRIALYVPDFSAAQRDGVEKILAAGRRAEAKVLTAAPAGADYAGADYVGADYVGIEDPLLRMDLEVTAWDEPRPWHARLVQPVPLSALELLDRGRRLAVAFFTVDEGESVAVDWAASR